ncbi:MAG TPA: glutamine synthetase adenylyltransferase, partial [Thermoanaerobaculia bacterium]|nr:glutamine synthetase adenylyltransferase [Thermoanaerobaculia bacterium]
TYEPAEETSEAAPRPRPRFAAPDGLPEAARFRDRVRRPSGRPDARKKTVDVFTVTSLREDVESASWERFEADLDALLGLLRAGRPHEARGEIARRAAVTQQAIAGAAAPLAPVDIEIDNASSDRYTVLHIDAPDTNGFLYELTNALAQNGVYIARMTAGSVGSRVRDTLWVTDAARAKITSPERQRELRATTVLIKHFTHLLPHSPNPESALLHFGELVGQLFSRPNWAAELSSLESPRVLDRLAQLLGVSDFLWSDFLRMQHANLFPLVQNEDEVARPKTRDDLEAELAGALAAADDVRGALNAFKDRELFRVDMRFILRRTADIPQFSAELTDLADVVVTAAFRIAHEELAADYGTLRLPGGAPAPDVVCGLGKCGGRELGFASDIELLFLHGGVGETDGRHRVGAAEYFEKLGQAFVGLIRTRKEGVFAIDLRLRPYGSAGPMAVSIDAFRRYYAADGPAWPYERQALIRLRPIAGDEALGRRVVALRDEIVYDGSKPDVAAHRAMRERQVRQLVAGGTLNLKFSPGGLVDVEYLVQLLQMTHGHGEPALRLANTREAMAALAAAGILSSADLARLREAHTVLRSVIEALRVVTGNAADVTLPPFESEAFSFLARRLGYGRDLARLRDDVQRVTASVREIGARLLG